MSALATFRRAMRRHEKRARRMGLPGTAIGMSVIRLSTDDAQRDRYIAHMIKGCRDMMAPQSGFLYSLAASAVSRLRAAQAEEERSLEGTVIRDVAGSTDWRFINMIAEQRMLVAIGRIPAHEPEARLEQGVYSLEFLADTPECEGERVSAAARAELARRARMEAEP